MESQTISRGLTGEMMVNTEGGNKFEISFYCVNSKTKCNNLRSETLQYSLWLEI